MDHGRLNPLSSQIVNFKFNNSASRLNSSFLSYVHYERTWAYHILITPSSVLFEGTI